VVVSRIRDLADEKTEIQRQREHNKKAEDHLFGMHELLLA
jgi:hypothetical protein